MPRFHWMYILEMALNQQAHKPTFPQIKFMPHYSLSICSLFITFKGLIAIMASNFHLSLYSYSLSGHFSVLSPKRSEKIFYPGSQLCDVLCLMALGRSSSRSVLSLDPQRPRVLLFAFPTSQLSPRDL